MKRRCYLGLDFIPESNDEQILREHLIRLLMKSDFGVDGGFLHYQMFSFFRRIYGTESANKLILWSRNSFVYNGDDRISEELWNQIAYFHNGENLPLAREFSALRNSLRGSAEIGEKNVRLNVHELTLVENNLIKDYFSDLDDLDAKILVVFRLNEFSRHWNDHIGQAGFEDLNSLYFHGKSILKKMNIDSAQLGFPGIWTTI
jgi:hypothetical protein